MTEINDHAGLSPTNVMQSKPEKISLAMKDLEKAHFISENQDVQVEESREIVEYTKDEAKKVKKKIDFILLPLLCLCYVFSV